MSPPPEHELAAMQLPLQQLACAQLQFLQAPPLASPCPPLPRGSAQSPGRRYLRHGMLPQLAAFEAVVRHGNATRAADELCIAQSTLSGHLRKLGDALGVDLFELRGKHLHPTDAAVHVLGATLDVFAALRRCEHALDRVRAEDRRRAAPRI